MAIASKAPPAHVLVAYGAFWCSALAVYHLVANGEFSSILTLSVMCQSLAIALLCLQVVSSTGAKGISARALTLEAGALACRLSSTLWLNGYLPVDASGDMVFQGVDIFSLMMVLWLLHRVLVVERRTYEQEFDNFPIVPVAIGSLVCAALLHADMNGRPIFDTLWMTGLLAGVVAVLPQLWLINRTGGVVQAFMSHHIAMMAVSRVLSGTFMWEARHDVTCAPWIEGFSHAIYVILGAHLLHLLLLGDFGYYYLRSIATKGLTSDMDLTRELDV